MEQQCKKVRLYLHSGLGILNKWQATLHAHFVDFKKVFDSIHREGLWRIMKAYDIPDKLIRMVKIMYDDFECSVLDEGEQTRWFKITTGVKQGCVMSGFLFCSLSSG